jgi:glycine oxidase
MNKYDAVIAGGGIIGGCIALELAEAGMKVGLYDAQEPGREASWASAGIISPAPESEETVPFVPMRVASASLYPEFIQKVEELAGKNVGYRRDGGLEAVFAGGEEEMNRSIALQHSLGLKAEAVSAEEARLMEPVLTEEMTAAIYRPDEASVDNRALTEAVLKAAHRKGVRISSGNGAKSLWKEGKRCKGLMLEKGQAEAKWTIIAAGSFSARIEGAAPYAPVFPAKGQMIALRCESVEIKRVLWLGHTYLVPRNDGRIIAGSTIERGVFDHEVTAGGMKTILNEAIKLVPELEKARIEETWAGLRPDSPDHQPIIGPTDVEGLLIATGHFRSGILLAPITARLIREWVSTQKVSVDWENVRPMRFVKAKRGQSA